MAGNDETLDTSPVLVRVAAEPAAADAGFPVVDPSAYQLGAEFARGSLGRLVRAHDRRLGRTVAIKQLIAPDPSSETRFRREAQINARLQHPGIVAVHEAGRWPTGELFYAMKLVSGRSLRSVLADTRSLDERLALLPNVLAVAEAVAYAHSQGVIHRDLKPSNVMVGAFGETVVIDWGLAKETAEVEPAGAIMGSPPYLAPEQARGEPADARADVYALGAILYHLLAGRPPYQGDTAEALLQAIRQGPPRPVDQVDPGVPADLATVVAKAMARAPAGRYPDAAALADDLRRFQTGQLVGAHRYTRTTLIARFLRRNRRLVAVAAAATVALALAGAVAMRRAAERDRADRARAAAQAREAALMLVQARQALELDPTLAIAWLKGYAASDLADPREVDALAVDAASRGVARHLLRRVTGMTFAPDGDQMLVAVDPRILLVDGRTGRRRPVADGLGRIYGVAFSADGAWLGVACEHADVRVWRVADLSSQTLLHKPGGTRQLALRGDGGALAVGDLDGRLEVIDRQTRAVRVLAPSGAMSRHLVWSPDGRFLVAISEDRLARLWDLAGSAPPRSLPGRVRGFAFAADGFLWAGEDGHAWRLDPGSGTVSRLLDDAELSGALAVSADGRWLAVSTRDAIIAVDRANGGRRRYPLAAPLRAVEVAGGWLAVILASGVVSVWDLESGEGRTLFGHESEGQDLWFSRRGDLLATHGFNEELRVWGLERAELPTVQRGAVPAVAIARGGGRLLAAFADGEIAGPSGTARCGPGGPIAAFAPDGQAVAWGAADGPVHLCADGQGLRTLAGHQGAVHDVAFSASSTLLASAGADHQVRLWRVADGEGRVLAGHLGQVRHLRFSPDDEVLVSAADDLPVLAWDLPEGVSHPLSGHLRPVQALAFAPDGALVTVGAGGAVRLWDVRAGRSRVFLGHAGWVEEVAYSPEGVLASAGDDRTLRLWTLPSPSRVLAHPTAVRAVAWSEDGKMVASGGADGAVRIWEAGSGRLLAALRSQSGSVKRVVFAGDRVAALGGDGAVRSWKVPGGGLRGSLAELTSVEVRAGTAAESPSR